MVFTTLHTSSWPPSSVSFASSLRLPYNPNGFVRPGLDGGGFVAGFGSQCGLLLTDVVVRASYFCTSTVRLP